MAVDHWDVYVPIQLTDTVRRGNCHHNTKTSPQYFFYSRREGDEKS